MILAIPKEIMTGEGRVAATPETVTQYRKLGFKVLVEHGAGRGIHIPDGDYQEAGAEVVAHPELLFRQAELVLKVKQPIFNLEVGRQEVEMMNPASILVSFLHPAAPSNHGLVRQLQRRHITSFTLDSIPRTLSYAQTMDALTSMSTVTGYRSVLIAADRLPRFVPMIGTAVGVTKPANFLIIGAGVVGLQAIATARRLGGTCTVVDIRPEAREQARTLGAKVVGFEVPMEFATGEGGYAGALSEEWTRREREFIDPLVAQADVVISSALVPGEAAPVLITEPMVGRMRPGTVIIDVAIDQGGNCALTQPGEEFSSGGVHICGLQNIPGRMAVDSSTLFARNVLHFVEHVFRGPNLQPVLEDEIARSCLVTHNGEIVHAGTLKALRESLGVAGVTS